MIKYPFSAVYPLTPLQPSKINNIYYKCQFFLNTLPSSSSPSNINRNTFLLYPHHFFVPAEAKIIK